MSIHWLLKSKSFKIISIILCVTLLIQISPLPVLADVSIPLNIGWNLVSIPEEPTDSDPATVDDTDPAVVLSSVAGNYTQVYAYDGCDAADPWKIYDPAAGPADNDLTVIDHKIGFWIEMTSADTLDVTSIPPTDPAMQLCQGWNLIGYPMDRTLPVAGVLSGIEGKYERVFGHELLDVADPWEVFDVGVPVWANDAEVMEPGQGYWLLASEDTTLTIAEPGTAPVVEFINFPDGTEITSPLDIVGTIDSPTTVSWSLDYRPEGDPTWTIFASGDTSVTSDVQGTFDPTLLLNGLYEIRVTATDLFGQSSEDTVDVFVEGQMKVGPFSISFVDLDIPVAGIPITLTRTYDSRDKRTGDFGVGWTLDISRGSYTNNRKPGDGWNIERGGLFGLEPCYTSAETKYHTTDIRFSDVESYEFGLQVNMYGNSSAVVGGCLGDVSFVQTGGNLGATLDILDDSDVFWQEGTDQVTFTAFSPRAGQAYEPDRVRLTTPEGIQVELSLADGVDRISDLDDNTLDITPGGIVHSSGKSVSFTRDVQDRLTRITDPMGNTLNYSYDANGDLISVTDQGGYITRFTYNTNHDLLDIIDPRGVRASRNEYDDDGRLVAVTDANGNRIELTHNIDTRQEVVRDRLGNVTIYEYDNKGNILSETDALGNTTTYTYDARDNKLSETDPLGNTTMFTYDERDNLLTETDPLGNTTSYTSTTQNQVLTITDPLGNTTTNTYDFKEKLLTTTDPLGDMTTYTYHLPTGMLISTTDSLGNTTTFGRGSEGYLVSQTDPLGNVTTYTYDDNGNQLTETTTRTDELGNSVTMTTTKVYDDKNRIIQTIGPDSNSTFVEYNAIGSESVNIDQNGSRTEHEYDQLSRLMKTTYPDGTTETITYDANSNKRSFTDRAGRTTQYEYDTLNRLIRTIYPDSSSTSTEYDAAGKEIATIDENSNRTVYEYDAAGRNTKVIDALGNITTYSYDANDNQTSMTDVNGSTIVYEYDALNRRTKTLFSDGTFISHAYDGLGRKTTETDQAGNTTQFEYDALGQLTRVINALGDETTYTYDEVGNKLTQTDDNGNTTQWTYDNLRSIESHTLPLGMAEIFTYDAKGNVLTHTDFNDQTTTFTYDVNDRLVTKTFADGTQVQFTYTATDKRATVTDSRGITTYNYDLRDRLIEVVNPAGSTIDYTYDAAGNRTSVSISSGTSTYSYDALNRLSTVTTPDSGVTTYTYDNVGNRASITYPNDTVTNYTYDILNRLITLENRKSLGDIISNYTYTLGPAGNRLSVVENSGRRVDYTYDALYRLVGENITDPTSGNQTISYTYDSVGNRLSRTDTSGTNTYTYDANDRLLTEGGRTYTYDDNGNTLSQTDGVNTTVYVYDSENRLVSAQTPISTITYGYDADGIRVNSTIDGVMTNYLVDKNRDFAQVLEERDVSGGLIVSYVYGDDLVSQKRNGNVSFYHYDGLGSTRTLTDASQAVTDTYTYEAFGGLIAFTGTTSNNYLFTGEQLDPNIGFYYLRARYMNPQTGLFQTSDTFPGFNFDPLSLHKYLYANADPVNKKDPSGNFGLFGFMIAKLDEDIVRALDNVGKQFLLSKRLGGAALRTLGLTVENAAKQVLTRLLGQSAVRPGITLAGQGGRRILDFWVQVGNKVAIIESKYKLPVRAGDALTRLVGQMRTALTAEEAVRNNAQVVLFTWKAPSPAQMRLLLEALGPEASSIKLVHGLLDLAQYVKYFFGIP